MRKNQKNSIGSFSMNLTIKDQHGNFLRIRKPVATNHHKFRKFLEKLDFTLSTLQNTNTPRTFELFNNFTKVTQYFTYYFETQRAYEKLMLEHERYKGKVISYS